MRVRTGEILEQRRSRLFNAEVTEKWLGSASRTLEKKVETKKDLGKLARREEIT